MAGTEDDKQGGVKPAGQVAGTVAEQIVDEFLTQLEALDGYKAVSQRLRQTILVDKKRSEAALRQALFGQDDA
jgi:hypothetical protein